MSQLNTIYYGPAGTGKTREAIIKSASLVSKQTNPENYQDSLEVFRAASKIPELQIDNIKLLNEIRSDKNIDSIVHDMGYEGYLNKLFGTDKNIQAEQIKSYRSYPLIETVTFHPSYSYQDFVEGLSVEANEKGGIQYFVKQGIFKKICERAEQYPDNNYVLLIDEINRGDISAIFGELFTLIEDSKRSNEVEALSINLPYSKDKKGNPEKLKVPNNLYIVATMNTVDKSIALVDIALRRRFDFIECMPEYEILGELEGIDLGALLRTINKKIKVLKNEHYQIGHSYLLNLKSFEDLKAVMNKKIIPLLQEYFYDDWQSICAVLNQPYRHPNKDIGILISDDRDGIFANTEFRELVEYKTKKVFQIRSEFDLNDVKKIYI